MRYENEIEIFCLRLTIIEFGTWCIYPSETCSKKMLTSFGNFHISSNGRLCSDNAFSLGTNTAT